MSGAARLYFSFRSPFSWLFIERLRRVAPQVLGEVELIPYWEPDARTEAALAELDAHIGYTPMSKAKHLYILQDTKRIAASLGVRMRWPVDTAPWWEPAHLGWLRARSLGVGGEFYDALVRARWERGEDISQPEIVAAAAEAAGLDGAAIAGAADEPGVRAEGAACLRRAYEDDIFGVPYVLAGWQRFWGYDRLDAFLEARAARPAPAGPAPPASLQAAVGAYDSDTAGGCG
jgi:2-hydroxychromene-2-carboxylate isomerase